MLAGRRPVGLVPGTPFLPTIKSEASFKTESPVSGGAHGEGSGEIKTRSSTPSGIMKGVGKASPAKSSGSRAD